MIRYSKSITTELWYSGRRKTRNTEGETPPLRKREANAVSHPNKIEKNAINVEEPITNRRSLLSELTTQ